MAGHHVAKDDSTEQGRVADSNWAVFGLQEMQNYVCHDNKPPKEDSGRNSGRSRAVQGGMESALLNSTSQIARSKKILS